MPINDITSQEVVRDCFFEGERPLYKISGTILENVRFYPGESPLKHTRDITARKCQFMSKYPFWNSDRLEIDGCLFTVYARAAIWYSQNIHMRNALVEAPKMFRQVQHLTIEDSRFPNAGETLWTCSDVSLRDVELKGADYVFMNGQDIRLDKVKLQGNYSFQDAKNVEIRNSHLDSKDAFWGTENVTVYDSVLEGEYLGWHSKNLRLVNCTIRGTQPLCYATNLTMVNCRMDQTDLCFEYSTLHATIQGPILSIKNPTGGSIQAATVGQIIIDDNCITPGNCTIMTTEATAA